MIIQFYYTHWMSKLHKIHTKWKEVDNCGTRHSTEQLVFTLRWCLTIPYKNSTNLKRWRQRLELSATCWNLETETKSVCEPDCFENWQIHLSWYLRNQRHARITTDFIELKHNREKLTTNWNTREKFKLQLDEDSENCLPLTVWSQRRGRDYALYEHADTLRRFVRI